MYLVLLLAILVPVFFFRRFLVDLIVLWTVATAARAERRKICRQNRLHAYVCLTSILDEVSVSELYTLARELVSSDEIDITKFHQVLLSYKYACMFRERTDGSLRGMLLLDIIKDTDHDTRKFTCIKLGLALFKHEYRGGPFAYLVCAYHAIKELVFRPRTPLYLVCKCFSYKSYLVLLHACPETYPRVGIQIPAWEKSLMDEFGKSLETDTGKYNPETCVVTRSHCKLKAHAAPLTPQEHDDENIKFFVENNPGWQQGHCLIVCCRITWTVFFKVAFQAIMRVLRTKETAEQGRARHLMSTSIHHESVTDSGTSKEKDDKKTRLRPPTRLDKQRSVEEVHSLRRVYHMCPIDPDSFCVANSLDEDGFGDDYADIVL